MGAVQSLLRSPQSRTVAVALSALAFVLLSSGQAKRLLRGLFRRQRRQQQPSGSPRQADPNKLRPVSAGKLIKVLVPSIASPEAAQILSIGLLCLLYTLLSDRTARLQGIIFKNIFSLKGQLVLEDVIRSAVLQLGMSVLNAVIERNVTTMALGWRKKLYKTLHNAYFKNLAYYKLDFVDKRVKNCEEILARDVATLCHTFAEISRDVIKAIFDGTFFTFRLASETSLAWSLVGWLYISSAVLSIRVMSPPFEKWYSRLGKLTQEFQASFTRVVANSEVIAALNGEALERRVVEGRFNEVVSHIRKMIHTQWWFGMIEDFIAKYCASTVAMVVIMGPFFGSKRRVGESPAARAEVLSRMRYVTSIIINQLTAIGGLARSVRKVLKFLGVAKRVGGLKRALQDVSEAFEEDSKHSFKSGDCIAFEDVEIRTPTDRTLVEHLTFEVKKGNNLLITGPNGAGKSSIFRCLGALWTVASGTITKPEGSTGLHDNVFYLPQKPYVAKGDLRQQLTYPANDAQSRERLTDDYLTELLAKVDLVHLITERADKRDGWEDQLSLGEIQRLAMARLLFHNPQYAILDECTSAVSADMERRLYHLCEENRITCITISHRPALTAFHDVQLTLNGDGTFSLNKIEHSDKSRDTYAKVAAAANSVDADDEQSGQVLAEEKPADPSQLLMPALDVVNKPAFRTGLKRLLKLVRFLVPSLSDKTAQRLVMLAGVVILRVLLSDRMAHMNGLTVDYLLKNDGNGFKRLVGISLMQCVASSILAPTLLYLTRSLSLDWRTRLQARMNDLFFKAKNFYKVTSINTSLSGPEQRMTEDLEKVCLELANTFPDIVKPIADILWFTTKSVVMVGPKNTALLYMYMVVGLAFLRKISPNFQNLVGERSRLEAAFKAVHSRVRQLGESIAFFDGGENEATIAWKAFSAVLSQADVEVSKRFWYGIADNYIIKQLPPLVTWALSYIYAAEYNRRTPYEHDVQAGGKLGHDLRVMASAVSHVFLALGEMLHLVKRTAELTGYAMRVTELEDLLEFVSTQSLNAEAIKHTDDDCITLEDVNIVAPTGNCLVRKLQLRVEKGSNVLVTGPNSSGKTSFCRVLGGLWPPRNGKVAMLRPDGTEQEVFFLVPQRPYCCPGRLADQVTYPTRANLDDEAQVERLRELLAMVALADLPSRHSGELAAVDNWEDVLSLGEQQRIGMARLFYHRPVFAALDQCTDAVSVDVERRLYEEAQKLGITIITISQRAALVSKHGRHLRLNGEQGAWQLLSLEGASEHDESNEAPE